jgi:hypothetical protein
MEASDLIKTIESQPCEEGAVHIWAKARSGLGFLRPTGDELPLD